MYSLFSTLVLLAITLFCIVFGFVGLLQSRKISGSRRLARGTGFGAVGMLGFVAILAVRCFGITADATPGRVALEALLLTAASGAALLDIVLWKIYRGKSAEKVHNEKRCQSNLATTTPRSTSEGG